MAKLFNLILITGQYPKEWKIGYIKPLFKGDAPLHPSNYSLSKLFNSILNNRLPKYFDDNKSYQ